jgi:hypothetical protein
MFHIWFEIATHLGLLELQAGVYWLAALWRLNTLTGKFHDRL